MSLLRFNKDFKYVVFDFETESLSLRYSRPWQLSFLVCQAGEVLEEHDYIIDVPNFNISKGAALITKFDWSNYNTKKRPPKEIWDIFDKYIKDPEYSYVGHNILGFDVYQYKTWGENIGMKIDWQYIDRCIDTNCLAKGIIENFKPPAGLSLHDRILWQYKLANTKVKGRTTLSATANKYGIEFDKDKLHDALEDIKLNQKVFYKQLFEIEI